MEQIELTVQKREVLGKQVRRLRREGWVPAVIYGHGVESIAIQVDHRELGRVLAQAGLSHLITLRMDDGEASRAALVREVQRDALTDGILHVDFLEVQMAEKLTTVVALHVIGESRAVEEEGGVLLQGITEVEIECLPGDLIDAIEVDISSLTELDQELTVAGLTVPPGIEILTEPHEMVVRVIRAPEEEEIEEEEILISPAEVEVIRGPRREEEIEEAEEGPLAESF
jgi:large subunit ribosomal protein L25